MPTGRPDYWYGTALYFENNPSDGETARGPTSNWAYDHLNDANAHHVPAVGSDLDHHDLKGLDDDDHSNYLHLSTIRTITAAHRIQRDGAFLQLAEAGGTRIQLIFDWPSNIAFQVLKLDGAVSLLKVDDDGNLTLPGTVDGIDIAAHDADGSAHHVKYLDADAVSAMGVKGDGNALHHDRYDDAEAVSAMGVKGDANDLHHDRFTDAEALTQAQSIIDDTPADGDTSHAPSSNVFYDHVNDAGEHGPTGWVFVNDGDDAGYDRAVGNFTKDATWRDWDISGLVGAQSCLVLIRVKLTNNTLGEQFGLRENGNSNAINISVGQIVTVNIQHQVDLMVMTDASGVIEYFASSGGTWAVLDVTIRGRWELAT